MQNKIRIERKNIIISNAIFIIAIFPSLLGVVLSFVGIKTYISLIAYGIASIYVLMLNGIGFKKGIWSLLSFIFFSLFSISYSISPEISIEKFISILYNILLPVTLIVILMYHVSSSVQIEDLFQNLIQKYSPYILIFLAILLLLEFTEQSDVDEGRSTIIGMRNPIWCSRFTGFLALSLILEIFRKKKIRLSECIGLGCAWIILISSGSRGPIISLIVVIILLMFPKMKVGTKILFILAIFIGYEMFITFSTRISEGTTEYSNLARLELINIALSDKIDIYIGSGIGSFGILYKGYDYYYYPHNIFLETYIETGLIGILLLFTFLISVFKKRKHGKIFYIYTSYFFINSLFSGDLCGNNNFFIFASILLSCHMSSKGTNLKYDTFSLRTNRNIENSILS